MVCSAGFSLSIEFGLELGLQTSFIELFTAPIIASSGRDKYRSFDCEGADYLAGFAPGATMRVETEAQLIARCRQGDEEAWDKLFDLHYAAAGRFVFQLSPAFSAEDVEEICQETFLAVIKNIRSFRGGSRLQTWVFRIATNKARDYRQRQQAAKRGGGAASVSLDAENPETGLTVDPPSPLPGPDALLLNGERVAQIGLALEQLGEPCREIIDLRYFGDLSYEEISAELKLNPKTVSSRLSKCLGQLEKMVIKLFCGGKSVPFSV
jgi:RNA polymerase sigma-70 factor (ECF subfamily)